MTGKTRIKSRPATRSDIYGYFGKLPGQSIKARVLEIDGKIVGLAGYYLMGGHAVMFSDGKEGIPKMTIWRESVAMMQSMKLPAICFSHDGSGPFLKRLGWTYVGPSPDGEVYKWQPS